MIPIRINAAKFMAMGRHLIIFNIFLSELADDSSKRKSPLFRGLLLKIIRGEVLDRFWKAYFALYVSQHPFRSRPDSFCRFFHDGWDVIGIVGKLFEAGL